MNYNRTTTILIILAMLTLSAGFSAGMLTRRVAGTSPALDPSASGGSLVEQLGLSPQQQEQIRPIWERARGDVQDSYRDALDLQRQRDQAVAEILSDDQKAQFERITQDFAGRFKSLAKQRDQAFSRAVDETNRLLTDSQRQQYARILKDRLGSTDTANAMGMVK